MRVESSRASEGRPEIISPRWTLRWTAPFVHAPTATAWSYGRRPVHVAAVAYLGGQPLPTREAGLRHLVLRYLAAFGPASVADVARWSGIGRGLIREVVDALESRPAGRLLRGLRTADGQELLDIVDAPLPDPETPAPVRLLPMWENALLGYDDRRRILADAYRAEIVRRNGDYLPAILVDGMAAGVWMTEPNGDEGKAGLRIRWRLFEPVSSADAEAVEAEAARLEAFLAPIDPNTYASYRRLWPSAPG